MQKAPIWTFKALVSAYQKELRTFNDFVDTGWHKAIIDAIDKSILNFNKGFYLYGAGVILNPSLPIVGTIYFTDRSYASEWKQIFYPKTLYEVDIQERK